MCQPSTPDLAKDNTIIYSPCKLELILMACYTASEFNYLKNFSHRGYVFFELNSKGKQTVLKKKSIQNTGRLRNIIIDQNGALNS